MTAKAEKHSRRNGSLAHEASGPTSETASKLHQESGADEGEGGRILSLARAVADSASMWLPYDELRRWESNPRKNDPAVPRMMTSIVRFGFVAPVVVWRKANRMVAGDTRIKAMRRLCTSAEERDGEGAILCAWSSTTSRTRTRPTSTRSQTTSSAS